MYQKDSNLALSRKVAQINEGLKSKQVLKLAQKKGGDFFVQLFEDGTFQRNVSTHAVERRFNAIKAKEPARELQEADLLSHAEILRRQNVFRSVLLDTINLENKLKEQLSVLQGTSKLSPFVIE